MCVKRVRKLERMKKNYFLRQKEFHFENGVIKETENDDGSTKKRGMLFFIVNGLEKEMTLQSFNDSIIKGRISISECDRNDS